MNCCTRLALVAVAALVLNGCRGDMVTPSTGPTFAVSDGAHDGNPDFFFLPPLFKNANLSPNFEPAAFNPDVKPTVEICELGLPAADGSRDCIAGDPLKRFGPSEITVSPTEQQYQVNWRTDESDLDILKFYRISVLVGTRLLGFADVDAVSTDPVLSRKEIKNLQTGEDIPLVDGRTLPIKFRIETGALCTEDPTLGDATPCTAKTINLAQGGGIRLVADGEDFRLDVAPGTSATIGGQIVTDVTFNFEVCAGIDVDLPTVSKCLRVSTFFGGTGIGELVFSKPLLISMCVLNSQYHTLDETRQEGLITLHQQDGLLILALPHAEPNCGSISPSGPSGWEWLKSLAARLLAPEPAYAASRSTRSTLLHVGAGGESDALGASCDASSSSVAPNLRLTTCAPSSPAASGPTRSPAATAALITPPRTATDFQFALPAKMDYVDPNDARRTAAPGTSLPTRVKVTDWYGDPVQGARVRFIEPAIEGPGIEIASALSDENGIAQFSWTIRAGVNTVVATGRGIAAQNNYPGGEVKPFMPDISLPKDQQRPVNLRVGLIPFVATGGLADFTVHDLSFSPAGPTTGDALTISAIITNAGAASAAPATVNLCVVEFSDGGTGSTCAQPETPALAPGQSATMIETLGAFPVGTYHVYASVDTFEVVPESDESNNSALGPAFTVTSTVIDFETFTDGLPACASCALTDQFGTRGLFFSFTSSVAGTCSTLTNAQLFLSSPVYDPVGGPLNHSVTAAQNTDLGGGFCSGIVSVAIAGHPTTVTFQLRGSNNNPLFPVNAFDPLGRPILANQITRSNVSTYTSANLVFTGRQETVTITNAGAVGRVDLPMNTGFIVLVDNWFMAP
jgi:hypothetical protein